PVVSTSNASVTSRRTRHPSTRLPWARLSATRAPSTSPATSSRSTASPLPSAAEFQAAPRIHAWNGWISTEPMSSPSADPPPEPVSQPADDRDSAYELFQRGSKLLADRHPGAAAVLLERASRLAPGKASILEALGRAYYNQGA